MKRKEIIKGERAIEENEVKGISYCCRVDERRDEKRRDEKRREVKRS